MERALEQARDGSLDAFNSLVEAYQDHLFALVARMVPDLTIGSPSWHPNALANSATAAASPPDVHQ